MMPVATPQLTYRRACRRYTDDKLVNELKQPTEYMSPAELGASFALVVFGSAAASDAFAAAAFVKTDALLVRDAFSISQRTQDEEEWLDQEMHSSVAAAPSGRTRMPDEDSGHDTEESRLMGESGTHCSRSEWLRCRSLTVGRVLVDLAEAAHDIR